MSREYRRVTDPTLSVSTTSLWFGTRDGSEGVVLESVSETKTLSWSNGSGRGTGGGRVGTPVTRGLHEAPRVNPSLFLQQRRKRSLLVFSGPNPWFRDSSVSRSDGPLGVVGTMGSFGWSGYPR